MDQVVARPDPEPTPSSTAIALYWRLTRPSGEVLICTS